MFPSECLDPPRLGRHPPGGGDFVAARFFAYSLKNLAVKKVKISCKALLVRVLSYSADPKQGVLRSIFHHCTPPRPFTINDRPSGRFLFLKREKNHSA